MAEQITTDLMSWLLAGDVSIQYQVQRDILGELHPHLKERISKEGWGAAFLACRNPHGHWGQKFYQPKWTSSHYTLLDLKNLRINPLPEIIATIQLILKEERGKNGCINPAGSGMTGDVCINGMFLNYASYFGISEQELKPVVDFILSTQLNDGGFNCHINRKGARHSSLHTTLSVLEGFAEYVKAGHQYRHEDILKAQGESIEFILMHHLFKSDHTGAIINPAFLRMPYPCRWKYDILRALDFFQNIRLPDDPRLADALQVLLHKRRGDGTWPLSAPYPGLVHFHMERAGQPSRWNTLRALRVLKHFRPEVIE